MVLIYVKINLNLCLLIKGHCVKEHKILLSDIVKSVCIILSYYLIIINDKIILDISTGRALVMDR